MCIGAPVATPYNSVFRFDPIELGVYSTLYDPPPGWVYEVVGMRDIFSRQPPFILFYRRRMSFTRITRSSALLILEGMIK